MQSQWNYLIIFKVSDVFVNVHYWLNSVASVFPIACCGVGERMRNDTVP